MCASHLPNPEEFNKWPARPARQHANHLVHRATSGVDLVLTNRTPRGGLVLMVLALAERSFISRKPPCRLDCLFFHDALCPATQNKGQNMELEARNRGGKDVLLHHFVLDDQGTCGGGRLMPMLARLGLFCLPELQHTGLAISDMESTATM